MRSYEIFLRKRKIIRYSCLILGIIIISYTTYKLTHNNHHFLQENHHHLPEGDNNPTEFSFQVDKPIFEGVNNGNEAYKITAHNIVKTSDIYLLEEVKGEYSLDENRKITFFSKHGNFNDHTKDLHLNDHVRIIYGSIEFFGSNININVRDKSFDTQSPVKIWGRGASIQSNSMTLTAASHIMELKGEVIATIKLNRM